MRLVTRGDLDSLTCAVLIGLEEQLDSIELVHPQDITDGRFEIGADDILANLPYHHACGMWFDHHSHTANESMRPTEFVGAFGPSPSAARLVYEYYGGEQKYPQFAELVSQTDRLDSADLTPADVLRPEKFIRLGFTLDIRTGLGSFTSYFSSLVELLREDPTGTSAFSHQLVERRCRVIEELDSDFREELRSCSRVIDNVVITDFRELDHAPIGNRFMIYALFQDVNVSVRLEHDGPRGLAMMSLGHSIFNRTCRTNVGELAARYGGGGHHGAASIPLIDEPEQQIQLIVAELRANG